jgi:hypothetical protein
MDSFSEELTRHDLKSSAWPVRIIDAGERSCQRVVASFI